MKKALTTFGENAEQLLANGYAPAPIPHRMTGPVGPWAVTQVKPGLSDDLHLPAILAACRPAVSDDSYVQNADKTLLAALVLNIANADALADVEEVVSAFVGEQKVLVREHPNGERVYLFRNPAPLPYTTVGHFDDARVRSNGYCVALVEDADGTKYSWRKGQTPLHVKREDLAPLGIDDAERLLAKITDAIAEHEDPTEIDDSRFPPTPPDGPLVPRDERLLFGNERALRRLRENGYAPAVPVPFGRQQPPGGAWRHTQVGWPSCAEFNSSGVGLLTTMPQLHAAFSPGVVADARATWIGYVEIHVQNPAMAPAIHAIVERYMGGVQVVEDEQRPGRPRKDAVAVRGRRLCPTRVASDGTTLRIGKIDAPWPTLKRSLYARKPGEILPIDIDGTRVDLVFSCHQDCVVISGNDPAGLPYRWVADSSPLEVKRDDLPALDFNAVSNIQRDIERFLKNGGGLLKSTETEAA
ncbi:MAG TPA: hypothetical protein VMF52_20025 [Steroidobacteraceae bacterium]|nr:hypothetical protein [Steroidobacteraceae bacterium]